MTGASSARLALLLQSICFPVNNMALSLALPAELQTQNDIPIGQNVQNLVDSLTADPDVRYSKSMMVACYIAVDHGDHDPGHFHDYPLSSNIGEFRDIRCVFRYGRPGVDGRDSLFWVQNQWPLHWDQWGPPSDDCLPTPFPVLPFSWRKAVSHMSAERANRLLKADGHRGPYALIVLRKTTAHPDGTWRFVNVQNPDAEGGGQRTFNVDVRTGRVDEEKPWQITVKPSLGGSKGAGKSCVQR